MGAPPPNEQRQQKPEPKPPQPGTPPAPPSVNDGDWSTQIDNLPPRYVYSHAPLPKAQLFNHDVYTQDSQHDKDFNPDMLTDERTSTG